MRTCSSKPLSTASYASATRRSADEEVTYQSLPDEMRSTLHTTVGELLIERGDPSELIAAAEHLLKGGSPQATRAALEAGEQLELTFSYDRAIALYQNAHRLTSSEDLHAALERRMVELKRLVGDYDGALENAFTLKARFPEEAAIYRRIGHPSCAAR